MFKPGISMHAIQTQCQCQCLVFNVTMFLPLLLLLCFFPAESRSSTVQTAFAYPSFNSESCNDGSLICMGSVSGGDGFLRLSMEPDQVNSSSLLRDQIGRVLYKDPVVVWPAAIVVTFTVRISTYPNSSNSGDGLTFIMAQDHNPSPPDSFGSFLGIMDKSTEGGVVRQLAVELDTYPNEFDPDGNHIGIDTTSIINPVVALSLNRTGIDLKSGRPVTVRLEYNSQSLQFRVYVAYEGNPLMSFFNHSMNLSQILPHSVYVGFTASTGPYPESHQVLSWNFQSTVLPETKIVYVKHKLKYLLKSIILALGVLVAVLVSVLLVGKILRDRKARARRNDLEYRSMSAANMPTVFSYKKLSKATKSFRKENLLGTGAFGSVYKGLVCSDPPTIIAVKKISATSQQGEKEYLAEICTIGRLKHKNLVQLQGWCHEGDNLLLVYEYMPNGSLDRYIGKLSLNWETRYRILTGLASALLYLHEECGNPVLHRDIKPNNIMLDSEFNTHLGDFGLARMLRNESCATTMLAGTPGYLAPEVSYTGKATPESDVYSFGVVVLEVVLGTRSKGLFESSLVDYAWSLYENDSLVSGVDRMLEGVYDEEEVKRALIVGLACVHPDATFRPKIRKVEQIFLNRNEPLVDLPRTMPIGVYVSVTSRNEISTTTTTRTTSFDCSTQPCLPSKEDRDLPST